MTATAGRKTRVAKAFGKAKEYDRHALLQTRAAEGLARRVLARGLPPLPALPRALEVGCGTGLLSRYLLRGRRFARYLCTDISQAMLLRCRERLAAEVPSAAPLFAVMDAEAPAARPGFDLVASSMALQWTYDLRAALAGLGALLSPGGVLVVSIPGRDLYREWRLALAELGHGCGVPDYPDAAGLAGLAPAGFSAEMEEERNLTVFPDGLSFLRSIKGVGAAEPAAGYRPMDPGSFRRALRRFEKNGAVATWHILYALFRRQA